jgi:hypothetical protein
MSKSSESSKSSEYKRQGPALRYGPVPLVTYGPTCRVGRLPFQNNEYTDVYTMGMLLIAISYHAPVVIPLATSDS